MDVELNLTTERVEQLRRSEPLCVAPTASVREVIRLLQQRRAGSMLVCLDGKLVGIFTERDALRLMAGGHDLDAPVSRVMTPSPVTVRAGETVAEAIKKMAVGGYRRLPIVDGDGRPVGKVNISGIMHYLVEHFPKAVYNLPPPGLPMVEREGA